MRSTRGTNQQFESCIPPLLREMETCLDQSVDVSGHDLLSGLVMARSEGVFHVCHHCATVDGQISGLWSGCKQPLPIDAARGYQTLDSSVFIVCSCKDPRESITVINSFNKRHKVILRL